MIPKLDALTAAAASVRAAENWSKASADAADVFADTFGLVATEHTQLCLARVAGQRCRRGSPREVCVCEHRLGLFDHLGVWARLGERRRSVMTAQPYGADLDAARAAAAQFGTSLLISAAASWHMPGSTTLLVFDTRGEFS